MRDPKDGFPRQERQGIGHEGVDRRRVHAAQGLVEEEHVGIGKKGAQDRDAAALAAGELPDGAGVDGRLGGRAAGGYSP